MSFPTDIRIREVEPWFRLIKARTPLKFGGVVMESVLYAAIRVVVENRQGKVAEGWSAMPLADAWGWPSRVVPHGVREALMKRLCERYCKAVAQYSGFAHPVDIFLEIEPELSRLSDELGQEAQVAEPMPRLNALICSSPVDGALHDAFGNVNGFDTYLGYGPDTMPDLGRYLGDTFRGKYPAHYLRPAYLPELPIFHLVGGLDKLTPQEVTEEDPKDGLPNCLMDWVRQDGLICLKVKWRGNDLPWDLERALAVYRIAQEAHGPNAPSLYLTGDTNEQCDTPQYMIELLEHLREASQEIFDALLYIEQPTHRDLEKYPCDFSELARLKPVIVDESLTDLEAMDRAMSLGATGIALKTCKGQSQDLLMIAKAAEAGIPYAVQDLSLPGLSLLQSVGLAARIYPIMGVEANGRQFFPEGSRIEMAIHAGLLTVQKGKAGTASLQGTGLGYQMDKMKKPSELPELYQRGE